MYPVYEGHPVTNGTQFHKNMLSFFTAKAFLAICLGRITLCEISKLHSSIWAVRTIKFSSEIRFPSRKLFETVENKLHIIYVLSTTETSFAKNVIRPTRRWTNRNDESATNVKVCIFPNIIMIRKHWNPIKKYTYSKTVFRRNRQNSLTTLLFVVLLWWRLHQKK